MNFLHWFFSSLFFFFFFNFLHYSKLHSFTYGRPPLHGQVIQQVIQQVTQQIIQLFWSFWVGVADCCMTFRDQNPISTTSEHVQMLQRLRTCCMSLIDKSVRWMRVTANQTAIIQLLTLPPYYYVIYYVIS